MGLIQWQTVEWAGEGKKPLVIDAKAAVAEMLAMTLFVIMGCGAACGFGASDAPTRLVVAFAFGMSILVLAYMVSHLSGGQINGAVTFSLVLGGGLPWYQGLANLVMQLAGSLLGAGILAAIVPCDADLTGNLGANVVNEDFGVGRALLAEAVGTFLLCMVVWEVAVSPLSRAGPNTAMAIGFAVFIAHIFLLPIDGCSINPTRSFGPAIVAHFRGCSNATKGGLRDLWVMWVGPLLGAALAAFMTIFFKPRGSLARELADEAAAEEAMASAEAGVVE
mmetsp:Transcript_73527/g.212970  ORF Transcript_73527/g.212970 Transcript_73527/m.212970 type:complete len:278 (-) Transcript_73527:402-1235(-)